MDLHEYLEMLIAFLKTNRLISAAIALLLLLFLRRSPKGFLKLTIAVLLVISGIQLLSHVVSTGKQFGERAYEAPIQNLPPDE